MKCRRVDAFKAIMRRGKYFPRVDSFSFVFFFWRTTHLNTYFREVDLHGELLPGVDVRIVGLLERSLEFVQLVGREGRPVTTMLLLASVAVYILSAACAEFLVAAAAGGVAAVLTWKPQRGVCERERERERGRQRK